MGQDGPRRPRLLDLFSGAGGAAMGYHRAGFDVFGVDIAPQPNYPFHFTQDDAYDFLAKYLEGHLAGRRVDAIHASPPCQVFTCMSVKHRGKGGLADARLDLLTPIRPLLEDAGVPYVIENVPCAKIMMREPITLTGEMFGLRVHRPRLFETNWTLVAPRKPTRQKDPIPVYGKMDGRLLWRRKDGSELRASRCLIDGANAMGIDWMTWPELTEAIPPAYAEFVGQQLLDQLD